LRALEGSLHDRVDARVIRGGLFTNDELGHGRLDPLLAAIDDAVRGARV
jgi:hypothetical protein